MKVRMEHAAGLLRSHPEEKVAEIAEQCGFLNSKHFHYVFKQTYRMTPGEYQKQYS